MTDIVLLYDADCPNIDVARGNLLEACAGARVPPRWQERLLGEPTLPRPWRGFGSPTVLIDDSVGRRTGAPSVEMLRSNLLGAKRTSPSTSQKAQAWPGAETKLACSLCNAADPTKTS